MRILFLAVFYLLMACGAEEHTYNPLVPPPEEEVKYEVIIDDELLTYVEEFEYYWDSYQPGSYVKNLRAGFGKIKQDPETPTTILGKCFISKKRSPRILIDEDLWENMTETRRRVLMMHELGHCVLFRDHVDGSNTSIMNPMIISDKKFEEDEEELLTELFDKSSYHSWSLSSHKHHINCDHGE